LIRGNSIFDIRVTDCLASTSYCCCCLARLSAASRGPDVFRGSLIQKPVFKASELP